MPEPFHMRPRNLASPSRPAIAIAVCALFASLWAAACANVNRAAQQLATRGNQAAVSYQQALTQTGGYLDGYLEGQYLLAPLTGREPPGAGMLDSLHKLNRALAARAAMMGALANTYTAFGELASYGAAQQTESALDNLAGAGQAYAGALDVQWPPIASAAGKIAALAGGWLVAGVQARQLREASILIRQRLEAIIRVMEKERQALSLIREEIVRGNQQTAIALWRLGIGSPFPIIESQIGSFGLTVDQGALERRMNEMPAAERAQLRAAIDSVIDLRARRKQALEADLVEANIDALRRLVAEHRAFEHDKPLDLQAVSEQISRMRAIVEQINQASAQAQP